MPSLEITTMVGCPLKCTYCPQDLLKKTYGKGEKYLSFCNFKAVLDKLPKYVRIDFSGMSEPWANPEATSMLKYALESGFNVALFTTLYGIKKDELGEIIETLKRFANHVDVICIHLPDKNGNMRGFRYSEEYVTALEAFLELKNSKLFRLFDVMTMDGGGLVHPQIQSIINSLGNWEGISRSGNLDVAEIGEQPVSATPRYRSAVTCPMTPFYDQNVLLPNGDVLLCCMDYGMKHPIGNLLESDYFSIFSSPAMGRLRAENMKTEFSENSLCKSCDRASLVHVPQDARLFWRAGIDPSNYRRIAAFHPGWAGFNGVLLLSNFDDSLAHEAHGSTGTYRLEKGMLYVRWHKYPAEEFVEVDGVYRLLARNESSTALVSTP